MSDYNYDYEEKILQGAKLSHSNRAMIIISALLYFLILLETIRVSIDFNSLREASVDYTACSQEAELIHEGSDYLTSQVRYYVVTLEEPYMNAYFTEKNVTRRRDTALEALQKRHPNDDIYLSLRSALDNSNLLMEKEFYAMRLICEAQGLSPESLHAELQQIQLSEEDLALSPNDQIEKARQLVFNSDYQKSKSIIDTQISYFLNNILTNINGNQIESITALRSSLSQQRVYISLLFVLNLFTFLAISLLILRPLNIFVQCIKEDRLLELTGAYEFKYLAVTYNNIYKINAFNKALLRQKAEQDPLTGLINRGAFEQLIRTKEDISSPVALLLIDVDNFKNINDTFGHEVGDFILKKLAGLLTSTFRSSDYPARIGGDEFAVLMDNITWENRDAIREKISLINDTLQNPEDALPPISISVGVAFSDAGYRDSLYKNADSALYLTKKLGRCGCEFFPDDSEPQPNTPNE